MCFLLNCVAGRLWNRLYSAVDTETRRLLTTNERRLTVGRSQSIDRSVHACMCRTPVHDNAVASVRSTSPQIQSLSVCMSVCLAGFGVDDVIVIIVVVVVVDNFPLSSSDACLRPPRFLTRRLASHVMAARDRLQLYEYYSR